MKRAHDSYCLRCSGAMDKREFSRLSNDFHNLYKNRGPGSKKSLNDAQRSYFFLHFLNEDKQLQYLCYECSKEFMRIGSDTLTQLLKRARTDARYEPPFLDPIRIPKPRGGHNRLPRSSVDILEQYLRENSQEDPSDEAILRLSSDYSSWDSVFRSFNTLYEGLLSKTSFHRYRKSFRPKFKVRSIILKLSHLVSSWSGPKQRAASVLHFTSSIGEWRRPERRRHPLETARIHRWL